MNARTFTTRWRFLDDYNYSDPCTSLAEALERAIAESRWGGSLDEEIEVVDENLNPVLSSARLCRILRKERESRGKRRVRLNFDFTAAL